MGIANVRVRAGTVRVRDQFVMARFGRLARDRFRASASERLRAVLVKPGDVWVDFDLFVEATELVIALFADGNPLAARSIGAFGAEANMGSWRNLVFKVLSPKTVLDLAAAFWSHHYDGGRLSTELQSKSGVKVRLDDFPTPHRLHCLSIEGWIERTIALGKPKRVHIVTTKCRVSGDSHCEWLGDWE